MSGFTAEKEIICIYLFLSSSIYNRISHNALLWLQHPEYPLSLYGWLCEKIKLPLSEYFVNVLNELSDEMKVLTIYDQLNPQFSHYYREEEITTEMEVAGFKYVKTHHFHGYSWTVTGLNKTE